MHANEKSIIRVENDTSQQRVENYIEYRLKEGNINSGWVLFHTQIFHFWDTELEDTDE